MLEKQTEFKHAPAALVKHNCTNAHTFWAWMSEKSPAALPWVYLFPIEQMCPQCGSPQGDEEEI